MKGTDREVKVSVIVPIYNVGTYLENGIKSLINQSYHNIEIIPVSYTHLTLPTKLEV